MSNVAREFWPRMIFHTAAFTALFLNFSYLAGIVLQLLGQIYLSARSMRLGYGAPLEWSFIDLPFAGRWKVLNGGVCRAASHSWSLLSQRYAYDFLIAEPQEELCSASKVAEDHAAWDRPLYAPASGVVVRVRDGSKDHAVGRLFVHFLTLRSFLGNHIVIRADSMPAFVLLAHLQQGSCIHRVGDRVHAGEYLGRCGNSGLSTEPHLHLQVQDGENFFFARSLPVAFQSTLVERNCTVRQYQAAVIERGDFVEKVKIPADAENRELAQIVEPFPGVIFLTSVFSLMAVMVSVVSFYMAVFQWILH